MDVFDEVFIIFAGTRGYLDDVPIARVAEWEHDFLVFMRDQKGTMRKKIVDSKDLDDAALAELASAVKVSKPNSPPSNRPQADGGEVSAAGSADGNATRGQASSGEANSRLKMGTLEREVEFTKF